MWSAVDSHDCTGLLCVLSWDSWQCVLAGPCQVFGGWACVRLLSQRPGQLYLSSWVNKLGSDICANAPRVDLGNDVVGSSFGAVHLTGPDLKRDEIWHRIVHQIVKVKETEKLQKIVMWFEGCVRNLPWSFHRAWDSGLWAGCNRVCSGRHRLWWLPSLRGSRPVKYRMSNAWISNKHRCTKRLNYTRTGVRNGFFFCKAVPCSQKCFHW